MADSLVSVVTTKGQALIHKVHAGRTGFNFTLFQAGDGHCGGNTEELAKLVSHRIDGKILHVQEMGKFTQFTCKITNQHLAEYMTLREVGIWADDPDEVSILYAYADLSEYPGTIGPFNGRWLHEEIIKLRVFTANATNITATIEATGFASEIEFINSETGLSATNVQDALVELTRMTGTHIKETVYTATPHGMRVTRYGLETFCGDSWNPVVLSGLKNQLEAMQRDIKMLKALVYDLTPQGSFLGAGSYLGADDSILIK